MRRITLETSLKSPQYQLVEFTLCGRRERPIPRAPEEDTLRASGADCGHTLRYNVRQKITPMPLFPIFVKLEGRSCLVVGGGKIAAAKAAGLLRSAARVVVVAPEATAWIQSKARAGELTWHRRQFTAADVADAFLAVAATDSNAVNRDVFCACAAHRVLCNVVDDPQRCDFFYPSVVRRGPLQIAISTGGKSPALARRLRFELEKQFGPEYAGWIEYLGRARARVLQQDLSPTEKRKLVDQLSSSESFQDFLRARQSSGRSSRKRTSRKADQANSSGDKRG